MYFTAHCQNGPANSGSLNGVKLIKIILVRHAQDDFSSLSELGKRQASAVADFLKEKGFLEGEVSVWHSPVRRAAETAATLIQTLGSSVKETCPFEWLSDRSHNAGYPLQCAIDDMQAPESVKAVVVVSHMPTIEEITHYFITRLGYDRSLMDVSLKNGTTIVIDRNSGSVEQVFQPNL